MELMLNLVYIPAWILSKCTGFVSYAGATTRRAWSGVVFFPRRLKVGRDGDSELDGS